MRWQIKFRHQTAKTPFGGQLYTHNWRQVNQYKIGNFDCIIFVIYHKNDREDWSICFIPTYKCIDPNNPLYVLKNIPPKLLKEGAEWKTEFNNFKNLFTKEN
jgi:hypothetical protein